MEEKTKDIQQNAQGLALNIIPYVPLRGKVLLPGTVLNFDVGRTPSVNAVKQASATDNLLFISAQKNAFIDAPKPIDLYKVGVVARIKSIMKSADGMKVSAQALYRARVLEFTESSGYTQALVEKIPYVCNTDGNMIEARLRIAKSLLLEFAVFDKRINKEMLMTISTNGNSDEFIDNALSVLPFKEGDIQSILETDESGERLDKFSELLAKEIEIAKIEKDISAKVRQSIDSSQKEYYLREQLKAIHSELGDDEDEKSKLSDEIKAKNLPKDIEEKCLKEIARLDKINPSSPDYSIILNYLDWIRELPFGNMTEDNTDIVKAKEILDKDHFGLEKVKDRILEYLAVLSLTKQMKGPILCFVGPPGVGKTSVAQSIARAINRKFIRMSLGGVKDEAEIRGHRRTYVGAMPGRIIYGIRNAGSSNPVFLLDEIDKLSSDIHGDPASALLEVLDPEQNVTFRDRYLEVPYDLSKVMFITTANSTDTIPYPLLDRMEIIELTGYTDEEKVEIAKRYLIPKQLIANGLTAEKLEITEDGIKEIIKGYTMEAGVRNLEREVAGVIRKVAVKYLEHPKMRKQIIDAKKVNELLGIRKHVRDLALEKDEIGAATGLAWTAVGGVTLTIEVSLMHGKGEILLTGKLGDVMKESARAAFSYIKANAEKYGVDQTKFENYDLHVHVPEGATAKDGPSAGITMATAMLSALIGKPVRSDVAMTGEITLRGKVLAIGGLKEKSLAAFRQGIKQIIIPEANKKDLEEIPKEIRDKITFITASSVEKVFDKAIIF